jgi:ABC-type nitrate/sulfonate/bicarbonate transport system substrate-binding protein
MIRDFLSAVLRGAEAAVDDPQGAVKAIEENPESNAELTPAITRAQVKATLPLLSQTGRMNPARASDLVAWMHEEGMIHSAPPASELFSNDFLQEP